MNAKPSAAVIVSLLVIIAAVGVVLYPVRVPPPNGKRASDMSRMKQLAVGAMIYAEDSSNCLPLAFNWKDATFPYIKNEFVYKCEHLSSGVNAYGHVYERTASGLDVMKIPEPRTQVMFFDGTNIVVNAVGDHRTEMDYARGGGTAHVAFADAHVKKVVKGWLGN